MSRFYRGGGGGGAPGFAKPENALARARELVAVGHKGAALRALHDVLSSKRHRTWSKVLEEVAGAYFDLCVDLRRARYAKDGLIHYRNVCQQVNVASLEDVVKRLLSAATDRAEAALTEAASASDALLDVDDLEAGAPTPDALLAAAAEAGGKGAAAAAGREAVTPWFRFAWDVHRAALDVLRNSARLEALYAAAAARAVTFCVKHRRSTEFRRLCDVLRSHLATLQKAAARAPPPGADAARDRPDLANPDTLALMLDARHDQLRAAVDLGMWQEAFRCVEDVAAVVALAPAKRSAPRAAAAATLYHALLTRVFGVAGAHLYAGYAWAKLLTLARKEGAGVKGGLTQTDAAALAANAALAALASPPVDAAAAAGTEADADAERDRCARVAALLGFAVDKKGARAAGAAAPLSRGALVADLTARGVLALAPAPVADIAALLETGFAPLDLCGRLAPLLAQLEATKDAPAALSPACPVPTAGDLSSYAAPLRRVALLRTLQQLATAYERLPLDALAAAVPFYSRGDLDAAVADAVARGTVAARIDHAAGVLEFGGPSLDGDGLRSALARCASAAASALARVRPVDPAAAAARAAAVAAARDAADTEHRRALARKLFIERRKEAAERAAADAEREEEEKRAVAARLAEAAEEERRRAERAAREEARLRAEIREREQEEARALLEAAQKKGGAKSLKGAAAAAAKAASSAAPGAALLEGDAVVDKKALLDEVLSEQAKARGEAERRAARAIKATDHFIRASRQEEAPLLEAAHAARLVDDEAFFKEGAADYAANHRASWEKAVAEKARLARVAGDAAAFGAALEERRAAAFAALAVKRAAAAAARRERAAAERGAARAREYVRRCRLQLEARRREKAEAEAAEAEERAAREAEERRAREGARPPPASGGGAFVPPSRRTGGFVPPALRGAGGGGGAAPPPRDRSPPPRRDDGPGGGGGGGRWMPPSLRRGGGDAPPPPSSRRDDAPPRRDDGPPGGDRGGGGSRWVPPSLRRAAGGGGGDAPPDARPPPGDAPPARVERKW